MSVSKPHIVAFDIQRSELSYCNKKDDHQHFLICPIMLSIKTFHLMETLFDIPLLNFIGPKVSNTLSWARKEQQPCA